MSFDPKNVSKERPPSLDKRGYRNFIHPANVSGYFRTRRNWFYSFLIILFLVVPWTTFQGKQTILLDLAKREFTFFGSVFYAHDGPMIFFPLFIAALGLVYITSVFGRAWCGWACPQTVFIDFVYRRIETWVEGNHLKRRKLDDSPMTFSKFSKKALKWFLFFLVSAHIAHSFTAYFVGAKSLVWITLGNPFEHFGLFLFVQFMTLLFLFDFGWFREQFCIIMCPYGRFQSVLMGEDSLAILYDEKRGEPRGKKNEGDCIDCLKCINVCPTGIDIRNGVQLECISCTACIDICDDVMEKIKKPKGLIKYSSVKEQNGGKTNFFNLRSNLYLTLLIALFGIAGYLVSARESVEYKILRAEGLPFSKVQENGENLLLNHFKVHLINQEAKEVKVIIELKDKNIQLLAPEFPITLKKGTEKWTHIFIKVPTNYFSNSDKIEKEIKLYFNGEEEINRINLLGIKSLKEKL